MADFDDLRRKASELGRPPVPRPGKGPPALPVAKAKPRQDTLPGGLDETAESPPDPRDAAPQSTTTEFPEPLPVEPESLPERRQGTTRKDWPPPPQRSVSPAPWDNRPELRRAVEGMGDRLVQAPVSSPGGTPQPRALRLEVGDLKGWAALIAAIGAAGLGVWAKTSSPSPPPGITDAPAEIAELRGEVARLRERLGTAERDGDEARAEARRNARRIEQAITELETLRRGIPRIEGVPK